jgi:DNA-binding transcriptional regulator YdaS (Cro superfamily)
MNLAHIFPPGRRALDAKRLGVSIRHLNGVAQGRRPVSPDLARRIIEQRPGEVSLEELFQVAFPEGTPVHRHQVARLQSDLGLASPADVTPPAALRAEAAA